MTDAAASSSPVSPLKTALRIVTFQATYDELLALDRRHLVIGLLFTWVVGMGRWWDDPGAHLLQHLGLGSVIYVFVVSLFLWLIAAPLRPENWSYQRLLTYITLTSPPAIFYAIPVERMTDLDTAANLNVWFLAVVALWRVGLLVRYLLVLGNLTYYLTFLATAVPVVLIIVALTMLNLERAVFEIMGGLRERTANDTAYGYLVLITFVSMFAALPLLGAYGVGIAYAMSERE